MNMKSTDPEGEYISSTTASYSMGDCIYFEVLSTSKVRQYYIVVVLLVTSTTVVVLLTVSTVVLASISIIVVTVLVIQPYRRPPPPPGRYQYQVSDAVATTVAT